MLQWSWKNYGQTYKHIRIYWKFIQMPYIFKINVLKEMKNMQKIAKYSPLMGWGGLS